MQSARTALSVAAKVCLRPRFISWTKTVAGDQGLKMSLTTSAYRPKEVEKNCLQPNFNYRRGRSDWSKTATSKAIGAGALFTAGVYGFRKALQTDTTVSEEKVLVEEDDKSDLTEPRGLEQVVLMKRETHTGVVRRHDIPHDKDDKPCGTEVEDHEPCKTTAGSEPEDEPEGSTESPTPSVGRPEATTARKTDDVPPPQVSDSKALENAQGVRAPRPIMIIKGKKAWEKASTGPVPAQKSPQPADVILRLVLFLCLYFGWVRLLPRRYTRVYEAYSRGADAIKLGECRQKAAFRKPPERKGPKFSGGGG